MDNSAIDQEHYKLRDSQPITLTAITMALRLIDHRNEVILKYRSHTNSINDDVYVDRLREFNNNIKSVLGI